MRCILYLFVMSATMASGFVALQGAKVSSSPRLFAEDEKKQITFQGLMELVTLGLGAPNLGKFKGVNKETGTLEFELESNRFIDKEGKEYNSFDNSKGTYFEYGEVDEDADVMKKLGNLFGGGNNKDEKRS